MVMSQQHFIRKMLLGILAAILITLVFLPAAVTKANNEYEQLTFYYPGTQQADGAAVEEQINEILREKLGVELSIQPLDWGSVVNQLNVKFAAGEPMDLVFSAGWLNDFAFMAENGLYLEMTDLMDQYAPALKKQLNSTLLTGSAYNGKLYAIPNENFNSTWTGVLLNETLVKKYKFDTSKIKKLSDIEPMLKKVKEKEKNVIPLYGRVNDFENSVLLERIGNGPGVLMPNKGNKVVNLYDTAEMKSMLSLYYNWTQKGYIVPSKQANVDSFYNSENAKKTFAVVVGAGSMEMANNTANITQMKWKSIPLRKNYISTIDVNGSMLSIPSTSQHPKKAMQLIELLHTDKELLNLFYWGIEGKHYKATDIKKGLIKNISEGYLPYTNWMAGNPSIAYRQPTDLDYKMNKASFDKAMKSPVLGLYYDFGAEQDVTNSNKLYADYENFLKQMNQKPTDPTKAIATLNKKLTGAGITKLIAEKQRQIDAFLNQ